MATSNAVAAKKAILELVRIRGVAYQVEYSPPNSVEREGLYGGRIDMAQEISAGRGSQGFTTRDEDGSIAFHYHSYLPGGTCEEAEERALEMGVDLEEVLALTTPDVPALLNASVTGYELTSYANDEAAWAVLTYQVRIVSDFS
jgi:hypothetical protein